MRRQVAEQDVRLLEAEAREEELHRAVEDARASGHAAAAAASAAAAEAASAQAHLMQRVAELEGLLRDSSLTLRNRTAEMESMRAAEASKQTELSV